MKQPEDIIFRLFLYLKNCKYYEKYLSFLNIFTFGILRLYAMK